MVGDSALLVQPIKKAMKQIEEDDSRSSNVVIYGLDVDPSKPMDKDAVKRQAAEVINEIRPEDVDEPPFTRPELDQITILGKLNVSESGKAPPVLVEMKNEMAAKAVLRNANKLSKVRTFRKVFISADMDSAMREKRKTLREELKKKIKELPKQHWLIRGNSVVSTGEHKSRERSYNEDADLDKSFDY